MSGDDHRAGYETARLSMARLAVAEQAPRLVAAEHLTRISAQALAVERVGVWAFDDADRLLRCEVLYQRSIDRHGPGEVIPVAQYPAYMAALHSRRVVAVDDARGSPLTRELLPYLEHAGITSMLDAPIIRAGRVVGVVCHEHVGEPRAWTQHEVDFASSVADMLTSLMEQADRLEVERRLRVERDRHLSDQKMEALGRMARSVAHDFNNVLAGVTLLTDRLTRHADPEVAVRATEIGSFVDLGTRLVRQLLDFGRRDAGTLARVRVAEALTKLRPALERLVGPERHFRMILDDPDGVAAIDTIALEQVVLNLVVNAAEATPAGGSVGVVLLPPPRGVEHPETVTLEVTDDGAGMDAETQRRVFEPYFTTKERGSGLGLATVYGIVQRQGGSVSIESAPGRGTRFTVALPRV